MTGPAPEQVLALFTQLGQQLGAMLDTALDVDTVGGTSDEWDAMLKNLGVAAMGEDERYDTAQADKQVKGPPIAEVAAGLQSAAKAAMLSFAPLSAALSAEQKTQLNHAVASLAEAASAQYKAQSTERKKGMFAHAKAAAQKHSWDAFGKNQGYVLKCGSCGAPRIQRDLVCAFCGNKNLTASKLEGSHVGRGTGEGRPGALGCLRAQGPGARGRDSSPRLIRGSTS
ncbi:MAG: hypothetical protein QM765_19560 [Myxococcales bacterium]